MAFDPDAFLSEGKPSPRKGKSFDPDAFLASSPAPSNPEDSPNFVSYLPPSGTETPAHLDLKNKRLGMVPNRRTNAVFTDTGQTVTPDELANAKRDTAKEGRDAFVGGALQAATLGFGDEIAALTSPGDYTQNRNENRRAFHEVEEKAPKDYAMGKLTGGAATMLAVPTLGPTTAKPLLSMANTGRAAFTGGLQALGETEKEDASGQLADTLKGAGVAAGVNTGLGLAGKGLGAAGRYLGALPERVAKRADDELIDAATLGAPATQRDALQGELGEGRPEVLSYIKARPELERALREKRPADAARIIRSERPGLTADDAATVGEIGSKREITVQPLLDRLEARRADLAKNPSLETQAEAASIKKRIDTIKEQWIPEPKPKTPEGGELLKTLVGSAQKYDVDRAAHSADDFLDVAKKYKLAKVANEPTARLETIDKGIDELNKANDYLYEQSVNGSSKVTSKANPPTVKLFRAAEDEDVSQGMSFATSAENARSYLKNPGFGGKTVYQTEISPKPNEILDLRGVPVAQAARKLGQRDPGAIGTDEWLPRTQAAIDSARAKGYKWAIVDESYPEGSTTWQYLGDVSDDEPELVKLAAKKSANTIYPKYNGSPIYVANLTGALLDHADTLGKEYGSGAFPGAVESFAKSISQTATARGETTISPRELRTLITSQQGKAFSGSFANPADAKEAWQEVTRVMRQFLEDHVEQNAGKGALNLLKKNNKEISILLPFRSSAEEEVAASRLLPDKLPETRTGQAAVSDIRNLANATKDEDLRREMTGELYQQIGPEASHRLAALDRQREIAERLEAPLVAKSTRDASPPTTLRSHAGAHRAHVEGMLERGGVAGGATLTAAGQGHIGIPVMVASIAAKYGHAVAQKAEDAGLAMVQAYRVGAQEKHLHQIAQMAGLPADVGAYLVKGLLPRETASAMVKSKESR